MNKRKTGTLKEEEAARWLEKQGVEVIVRNFRCRVGEIDLIARYQGYLIFIEVKYRRSISSGYPAEAVTLSKRRNICKVADFYRSMNYIPDDQLIRYDVIGICNNEIAWYQDAFDHILGGYRI